MCCLLSFINIITEPSLPELKGRTAFFLPLFIAHVQVRGPRINAKQGAASYRRTERLFIKSVRNRIELRLAHHEVKWHMLLEYEPLNQPITPYTERTSEIY